MQGQLAAKFLSERLGLGLFTSKPGRVVSGAALSLLVLGVVELLVWSRAL